jgi:hypothetical protein
MSHGGFMCAFVCVFYLLVRCAHVRAQAIEWVMRVRVCCGLACAHVCCACACVWAEEGGWGCGGWDMDEGVRKVNLLLLGRRWGIGRRRDV